MVLGRRGPVPFFASTYLPFLTSACDVLLCCLFPGRRSREQQEGPGSPSKSKKKKDKDKEKDKDKKAKDKAKAKDGNGGRSDAGRHKYTRHHAYLGVMMMVRHSPRPCLAISYKAVPFAERKTKNTTKLSSDWFIV